VRARRAGLAASAPPVARPAAPAQVSTAAVPPQSASRFGATPAQPVPAAAAATGNFHMDWGGPESARERAERPAAASGEPPRPAPPPASGEKELFRRL
jgi:hypothetical protein